MQGVSNRLDIDEFETGLMRIAKESFSTKDNVLKGGNPKYSVYTDAC